MILEVKRFYNKHYLVAFGGTIAFFILLFLFSTQSILQTEEYGQGTLSGK